MLLRDSKRGNTMLLQQCEIQLQKCAKLQIHPHAELLCWAFHVCNKFFSRGGCIHGPGAGREKRERNQKANSHLPETPVQVNPISDVVYRATHLLVEFSPKTPTTSVHPPNPHLFCPTSQSVSHHHPLSTPTATSSA